MLFGLQVTLEKVLGITAPGNRALSCDPRTGLLAYPAGWETVMHLYGHDQPAAAASWSVNTENTWIKQSGGGGTFRTCDVWKHFKFVSDRWNKLKCDEGGWASLCSVTMVTWWRITRDQRGDPLKCKPVKAIDVKVRWDVCSSHCDWQELCGARQAVLMAPVSECFLKSASCDDVVQDLYVHLWCCIMDVIVPTVYVEMETED